MLYICIGKSCVVSTIPVDPAGDYCYWSLIKPCELKVF